MSAGSSYQLRTDGGYDFFEVSSALQKAIRRGLEEDALYWCFELCPRYEQYLWRRLKVIVNEDIGIANPTLILLIQVLAEQYFEMRQKDDMSCTLCLANAVMLMCRSEKTRIGCHLAVKMEQTFSQGLLHKEIPDYALDMHTNRGRAMGRGYEHFRKEGMKLVNEAPSIKDRYVAECFELLKTEKGFTFKGGKKPCPRMEGGLADMKLIVCHCYRAKKPRMIYTIIGWLRNSRMIVELTDGEVKYWRIGSPRTFTIGRDKFETWAGEDLTDPRNA